jgi:hypothetical protein
MPVEEVFDRAPCMVAQGCEKVQLLESLPFAETNDLLFRACAGRAGSSKQTRAVRNIMDDNAAFRITEASRWNEVHGMVCLFHIKAQMRCRQICGYAANEINVLSANYG